MAGEYNLGELGGVLGGDLYNELFGSMGFTGNQDPNSQNPWMEQLGFNEGGNANWGFNPTENALSAFDNYSFNWNPEGGNNAGTLTAFDPQGKQYGTYRQEEEDGFTQLMGMVAPAIASWGFGGALSGMFGGGMTGGALGHGLASGSMSSMQGGNFGQGFLSGAIGGGLNGLAQGTPAVMGNNPSAYVPATPGTSLAGLSGITNPTLAGMFNRGVGSALGGLATGKSGTEALRSGLLGAGLAGANSLGSQAMDFMGNAFKGLSTPEMDGLGDLPGNMVSDPMDQSVDPSVYSDEGARFDNSADFSYGFPSTAFSGPTPDQSPQSVGQPGFSLESIFGNGGGGLGRAALSNVGDLASMLYGFYNNRRQQKALSQQIAGLQGLYGQSSPYAQNLRNTLNAKAAATGRRSNTAGRETQFQAMLADRNAQMAPTLMQLNMAKGGLKNNNMNMLLQGANKLGMFSKLGDLFKDQNPFANYSMANNTSDYNILGIGRP